MTTERTVAREARPAEAGFTLIEALIAILILIFGVAAIANLMVVAGTSNTAANHSTAATIAATEQMDLLKAVPYAQLVPGQMLGDEPGRLTFDVPPGGTCGSVPATALTCTIVRSEVGSTVSGGATIHVRWRIVALPGSTTTRFIEVQAQSLAPAMAVRSRAWLTTFRTM